jgi:hypothetical protein
MPSTCEKDVQIGQAPVANMSIFLNLMRAPILNGKPEGK